jgi:FtsZ-interacting cell division protein ZipA
MPSLTVILIIVGAALIGVVILYNYVQEERFRRQASRLFSRHDEDIMLGESVHDENSADGASKRVQIGDQAVLAREAQRAIAEAETDDPSHPGRALGVKVEPAAEDVVPPGQAVSMPDLAGDWGDAPGVASTAAESQPPAVPVARIDTPVPLDAETECIARLRIVSPSVGGLTSLISGLRRIGKPLRAFGQRPDGSWEPILVDTRGVFAVVAFGLQLADRSGPTSLDQINAFCRQLYEFAAEDGGAVTCPDKAEMLRRAAELDAFCMDVDILIGLTLSSSSARPFTSEALHGTVSEHGLQVDREGVYVARDADGLPAFTLSNQESAPFPADGRGLTTHGVILQLDVPRVSDGLAAFDQMSRLAFELAQRLQGKVVDQKGRVWSEDHLARDRAHLAELYARMQARDVPAGGERALRLFA